MNQKFDDSEITSEFRNILKTALDSPDIDPAQKKRLVKLDKEARSTFKNFILNEKRKEKKNSNTAFLNFVRKKKYLVRMDILKFLNLKEIFRFSMCCKTVYDVIDCNRGRKTPISKHLAMIAYNHTL